MTAPREEVLAQFPERWHIRAVLTARGDDGMGRGFPTTHAQLAVDGEWVRYEDFARLRTALAAREEELREARGQLGVESSRVRFWRHAWLQQRDNTRIAWHECDARMKDLREAESALAEAREALADVRRVEEWLAANPMDDIDYFDGHYRILSDIHAKLYAKGDSLAALGRALAARAPQGEGREG